MHTEGTPGNKTAGAAITGPAVWWGHKGLLAGGTEACGTRTRPGSSWRGQGTSEDLPNPVGGVGFQAAGWYVHSGH